MRKFFAMALLGAAAASTRLVADEGRIPIFAPTIITRSGHYVLTRDIAVNSGDVITVHASGVVLDFNGHTISSASTGSALVQVDPGMTDVSIRNGRLSGGAYGVLYGSGSPRTRIRLEALQVDNPSNTGIFINGAEDVEVRSCHVTGGPTQPIGIDILGVTGPFGGRIVDNMIETRGNLALRLSGLLGGEVRGNRVSSVTMADTFSVILTGPPNTPHGANLIEGNTVIAGSSLGIFICADCDDNAIVDNVIVANGSTGLSVLSSGNRIANNVLASNGGAGLGVSGSRNLIEGNQVKDNAACGISFGPPGTENAYRNNMLRGNAGGAVCGAATDAGGNIP